MPKVEIECQLLKPDNFNNANNYIPSSQMIARWVIEIENTLVRIQHGMKAKLTHWSYQSDIEVRIEWNLMRVVHEFQKIRVRPIGSVAGNVCDLLVLTHWQTNSC